MTIDPAIEAVFGPAPSGLDLNQTTTKTDNGVVIALAVLAGLAICGRIWARNIKGAHLWIDDYLLFASFAFVVGTMTMTIVGGAYGSGRHVWNTKMSGFLGIMKTLYGYTFIYGAGAACIKMSFIFYFIRIFHTGAPSTVLQCRTLLSRSLVAGGILSIAYPMTVWFTELWICRPIHYFWSQYTEPGTGYCYNTNLYFIIAGAINMIVDIYILTIPIPQIVKLQIRKSDKTMLVGIFALGLFVCIASAMRIYYLKVLSESIDVTYAMGPVFIWSSVEPSFGILSSCLISLRPIFKHIWAKISGHESTHSGKSYANTSAQASGSHDYLSSRRKRAEEDDELALVTIDASESKNGRSGAGCYARESSDPQGITISKDIRIEQTHVAPDHAESVNSSTTYSLSGWR